MDYKIKEETLTGIADAIRSKTGKTEEILAADFANNIKGIDTSKQEETANVALDFSAGDMEVIPSAGKVISKVTIPQPETLIPENIAEGIDIAGIVGTRGAKGNMPCLFTSFTKKTTSMSTSSGKSYSVTASCTIPLGAKNYTVFGGSSSAAPSSSSYFYAYPLPTIRAITDYTKSENTSGITITKTSSFSSSYTRTYYFTNLLMVSYMIEGATLEPTNDGYILKCDSSVLELPAGFIETYAYAPIMSNFNEIVEFSAENSGITIIPDYLFYNNTSLKKVALPSTLTTINQRAFYGCSQLKTVDFSALTSVPTLANTDAFTNIAADCEIKVPAELYDEWIAATNWTAHADKIVAV